MQLEHDESNRVDEREREFNKDGCIFHLQAQTAMFRSEKVLWTILRVYSDSLIPFDKRYWQ